MNWFTPAIELLIPTLCMVCETPQTKIICRHCLQRICKTSMGKHPACRICALPLRALQTHCTTCLHKKPAFDETVCIDAYEGVLQVALHALKYQKRIACAAGFAYLWNYFHHQTILQCQADILLPVPISQGKLAMRGFNQAWEIARHLQLSNHLMKLPNLVARQENGVSVAKLKRRARIQVTQDLFYLNKDCGSFLKDKHVVIFDDVMTTGSTINALASFLKAHGVKRVSAWTILRTLPK
jgi:ComF family protein